MKLHKAEEIYNSRGVIDVTYKDRPVWIESISEQSEVAHVKDLETNELKIVPILELKEE